MRKINVKMHVTVLLLLTSLPAVAATVEIQKNVREKTAATLGIPADGVPPHGVKAYTGDRAAAKAKASAAFANNPVAAKVKGGTAQEQENERAMRFRNGSIEFEVSKAAGAEILLDLDRYGHRGAAAAAVDNAALERTARAYIRAQMPDVNPAEVHFAGVKRIMDGIAQVDENGAVTNKRTSVANYILVFERKINNVRVVGPGEKIRIYASAGGEVIGHSKIWRELDKTPRGAKPVVPPGRVQELVGQSLAKHPAPSVQVDYFEFGYMGRGRYDRQDTLNPVYLVGFKAGPESKRVIKVYDAYTGAEIAPPADPPGADKTRRPAPAAVAPAVP